MKVLLRCALVTDNGILASGEIHEIEDAQAKRLIENRQAEMPLPDLDAPFPAANWSGAISLKEAFEKLVSHDAVLVELSERLTKAATLFSPVPNYMTDTHAWYDYRHEAQSRSQADVDMQSLLLPSRTDKVALEKKKFLREIALCRKFVELLSSGNLLASGTIEPKAHDRRQGAINADWWADLKFDEWYLGDTVIQTGAVEVDFYASCLYDSSEGHSKKRLIFSGIRVSVVGTSPPQAGTGRASGTKGRPKGSGSLAPNDAPLLEEMKKMLSEGKANSVSAAAQKIADKASGAGTEESKRKRLERGYQTKYGAGSDNPA